MTKAWFQSKIFWTNVAAVLALTLGSTAVTGLLPDAAVPYLAGVTAFVTIVLRVWFTDTALT